MTREQVWRRYDAVEARLTAPLSERMVDLAQVAPGMRVLDVATGRGEPALRLAQRVGSHGAVLCVEPDDGVLQIARERAAQKGLANLEFRVGAAEALGDLPPGSFGAATIRWGLMYLPDPIGVLRHLRRALAVGARLVVALMTDPERSSYFSLPRSVLARFAPLPPIDFTLPGPFRFAERAVVDRDFVAAGFVVEHVDEMEVPVFEAEHAVEVAEWCRVFGMERLLAPLPRADQQAWEAQLCAEVERTRVGPTYQLSCVTRIVVARF